MVESINVKVDELRSSKMKKGSEVSVEPFETECNQESDDDEEAPLEGSNEVRSQQGSHTPYKTPNKRCEKNHPPEQIIGSKSAGVETRRRKKSLTLEQGHFSLLSTVEPSSFEEASNDKSWVKAMEEELDQI